MQDDIEFQGSSVFEGNGLNSFNSLKQKTSQGGLEVETSCYLCGAHNTAVLEWPELFMLALFNPNNPLMPPGWRWSNKNSSNYVSLPCGRCSKPSINIYETPQNAKRHVQQALQSGTLPPNAFHALCSQAAQVYGVSPQQIASHIKS